MITLTALLLALALAPVQPVAPVPPGAPLQEPLSEERIKAAAEAIAVAFARDTRVPAEGRIEALLEHGWIDDERVIIKVAMGLYDKRMEVKTVAVEMLGGMQSERSIAVIIRYFDRRHPKLRLEVELWTRIFRAVARRGKPLAIPTLLKNVRGQMEPASLRARLFGLANIRCEESIEGVFAVLEDLDEAHRTAATEDARTALFVLSGQRLEGDAEALLGWWTGAQEDLALPAEAPRLEGADWEAWRAFWELPKRAAPPADEQP